MTLLTAGALTDPQLPATASNVCMTDARLGAHGVGRVPPPNTNHGYALLHWYVARVGLCISVRREGGVVCLYGRIFI